MIGTLTDQLRQCPRCRYLTRWLSPHRRCRNCANGWAACGAHGRLEHESTDHVRVSVSDVMAAVPDVRLLNTRVEREQGTLT